MIALPTGGGGGLYLLLLYIFISINIDVIITKYNNAKCIYIYIQHWR
jgi:hypothetical protein